MNNSTVTARQKGGWGAEAGEGDHMVTQSETSGGGRTMQCADAVVQSCALDAYIVLLTSVTPIGPATIF